MKKNARVLALILASILLISLVPVCASAEVAEPELSALYSQGLLVFGDSYGRGMGSTDPWKEEWNALYYMDNVPGKEALRLDTGAMIPTTTQCRNIEGSFAYLLAQSLGCVCPDDITDKTGTFWPIAQNALTLGAVMDLLGVDDGFFDSTFYHKVGYCRDRYDADLYYFGGPYSVNADGTGTYEGEAHAVEINQLVKDSKLIVLELGMGDIFNRTYATLSQSGLLNDLTSPTAIAKVLKTALSLLYDGFDYWETNFPVLINHLKELNEDATIVALSAVNTFFGTTLTHSTLAPIGTAFSALSAKMNSKLKEFSKDLDLVYVDISNVETGVTENEMDITDVFSNLEVATHPTRLGHTQICNMILKALKNYNGITKTRANDIVLDIGRFDNVDSVCVNGIPTKNYTVEDHTLTIHCNTKFATSLAVSANLNSKSALTTYQLTHGDSGYSAYRTYTTNNRFKLIDNLQESVKSISSKISSNLSSFSLSINSFSWSK